MQMNLGVDVNNRQQADQLRRTYFPNTSSKQTRDSFIFDQCITSFKDDPKELLPFIEDDEKTEKVQRMVTLKSETNSRLRTIAGSIGKPIATTFRAIIAYSIAHIDDDFVEEVKPVNNAGVLQLIGEKIELLQTQIDASNRTLDEIKLLLVETR